MREYIDIINEALKPVINLKDLEKDLEILFRKIYVTNDHDYNLRHIKLLQDHDLKDVSSSFKDSMEILYRFEIVVPFWKSHHDVLDDSSDVNSDQVFKNISKSLHQKEKYQFRGLSGKIHRIFKKYIPGWAPGSITYYKTIREFEVLGDKSNRADLSK